MEVLKTLWYYLLMKELSNQQYARYLCIRRYQIMLKRRSRDYCVFISLVVLRVNWYCREIETKGFEYHPKATFKHICICYFYIASSILLFYQPLILCLGKILLKYVTNQTNAYRISQENKVQIHSLLCNIFFFAFLLKIF